MSPKAEGGLESAEGVSPTDFHKPPKAWGEI